MVCRLVSLFKIFKAKAKTVQEIRISTLDDEEKEEQKFLCKISFLYFILFFPLPIIFFLLLVSDSLYDYSKIIDEPTNPMVICWYLCTSTATFILWKEQSIAIMRPELQSDFEINSSAESNTKSMAAMMLYVVLPFVMCEVTMGVLIKTLYSAMPTMELNAWQIKFAVIIFYPLILSTILYTIISIMHMHIVLFTRFTTHQEWKFKNDVLVQLSATFRALYIIVNVFTLFASLSLVIGLDNCLRDLMMVQASIAISIIVAIVSLKSGDEAKCEGKLIDMVNNICNAFGKFHLLIPILFTAMKYIAMKILKQLTLSNIAFEYEEDKERIQREKMSSFVAIVGCIYIFLKVREVSLKFTVDVLSSPFLHWNIMADLLYSKFDAKRAVKKETIV